MTAVLIAPVARPARSVAVNLYDAIMLDNIPSIRPAALVDFGLDGPNGQQCFEALYYPVRAGEITLEQLDAALGDGPALTALVAGTVRNPHPGVVFRTAYDGMTDE